MWNFKSLQKPLVFLFLLCLFPLGTMAQSIVKGTVNDESGEPVIGATVKVKGSSTGAITDFNGNFSLQANPNASLEISYVGYATQTVAINGQSNLSGTRSRCWTRRNPIHLWLCCPSDIWRRQ